MSPNIDTLPLETLLQILNDQCISRRDWKEIRLVCRSLSNATAVVLFRTVYYSQLINDRDALLSIVERPYLATHVQTLVWYELYLDDEDHIRTPGKLLEDDGQFEAIHRLMDEAATDPQVFWHPRSYCPDEVAREGLRSSFFSAIRRLPNLHTVVSQPMPDRRLIPCDDYPITADLYNFQKDYNKSLYHIGLFQYLLPALAEFPTKIKHLHWVEEGGSSITYLDFKQHSICFQKLQSIYLSLDTYHKGNDADRLARVLGSATDLRQLTLRFHCEQPSPLLLRAVLKENHWVHLNSIGILGAEFQDTLLEFVERHSKTLRQLHLSRPIISKDLEAMRHMSDLRLDSITISYQQWTFPWSRKIPEDKILAFINGDDGTSDMYDYQYELNYDSEEFDATEEQNSTDSSYDDSYSPPRRQYRSTGEQDLAYAEDDNLDGYYRNHANDECLDPEAWPRWDWGREGRKIYYWPVESSDGAETKGRAPTTMWRFEHRDGREVFGGADLVGEEYFSDWDSEAGDEVHATPFGTELTKYVEHAAYCLEEGSFRRPPADATLYDYRKDPCKMPRHW
ncbi:hypothetical protein F5X99DRAFT_413795 [Biscogniauxia marginata]|nr:hypothetical protein F5X99DRAFT_413795 [Biscogniauxia marginata]